MSVVSTPTKPVTKKSKESMLVRVFVYPKDGHFYGCCLELNLVTQADSPEEAFRKLDELIMFHIRTESEVGKRIEDLKRPAPLYFYLVFYRLFIASLFGMLISHVTNKVRIRTVQILPNELIPLQYVC